MKPQWATPPYPGNSNLGFNGRSIWWNRVLTLDEKSRLDQLMGAALLDPDIAERLLRHDEVLIDRFKFSPVLRQWLLQTEAASIQEFAQIILDKLKTQVQLTTTYEDHAIAITPKEVKQAAHISLLSLKGEADHPLQTLRLVDEYLTSPYFPTSPLNRKLALQTLLAQVITDEFKRCCSVFDIRVPEEVSSLDEARSHIHLIAHRRNSRLTGWSWLYYRYVCVDLDISADTFAQMIGVDKRTLRRYQQAAFRLLAERLIILESQARLRTHAASLEDQPVSISILF